MSHVGANERSGVGAPLVWLAGLALLALYGSGGLSSAVTTTCERPALLAASEAESGWVAVACDSRPATPAPTGLAGLLFGTAIDLNRDPARALEALPGIGPARAEAIVAARETKRFCAVEDLMRVSGIGPKRVERLRGMARAACETPVAPGIGR